MKVILENEVYRKIMHWVNKSHYEVSGLGTLEIQEGGIFRVTSAMLLPQKNGTTHTDIESEDVGKLMYALRESPGQLRFWWHSHVDMPVFWSGTDMDTIRKISAGGWFLSTVFNKKNEMKSAYCAVAGAQTPWGPQEHFEDNLETTIMPFIEPQATAWDEEYRINVTNSLPVTVPYTSQYAGYRGYENWDDYEWDPSHAAGQTALTTLPDKRPKGMPKKEWKALRKGSEATHVRKIINPLHVADEYGFTRDERAFLAQEGWDDHDIDCLMMQNTTPSQILRLAEYGLTADDAWELMGQHNWSIEKVLEKAEELELNEEENDVPVMDRAAGGKYDN